MTVLATIGSASFCPASLGALPFSPFGPWQPAQVVAKIVAPSVEAVALEGAGPEGFLAGGDAVVPVELSVVSLPPEEHPATIPAIEKRTNAVEPIPLFIGHDSTQSGGGVAAQAALSNRSHDLLRAFRVVGFELALQDLLGEQVLDASHLRPRLQASDRHDPIA